MAIMQSEYGKMRQKRRGRPRIDLEVDLEIRRLSLKVPPYTAPQILHKLAINPEFADKLPSERLIRGRLKQYRDTDTSDPWSLAFAGPDAEPEDAALVLPVLAKAIERGEGSRQQFSQDLASWIVKVRVAAPDIPLLWAFSVALAYQAAVELYDSQRHDSQQLEGLDQMLAFAPWRDKAHFRRYLQAVITLHPEWFTDFKIAENGEPVYTLSYSHDALGFLIALTCWKGQVGDVPDWEAPHDYL